jgi:hypothetical protein
MPPKFPLTPQTPSRTWISPNNLPVRTPLVPPPGDYKRPMSPSEDPARIYPGRSPSDNPGPYTPPSVIGPDYPKV